MKIDKKDRWILALLCLAAVLWITGTVAYSVGFILKLSALGCIWLAFVLWLTGPFKSPRARRFARVGLMAMGLAAALALGSFVWIECLIFSGREGDVCDDADILVVLGAGLRGTEPSAVLRSRLDVTYDYMAAHPDCSAILTGSQGPNEEITEAQAMFNYLTGRGIEAERLYLEQEAHNTAQNIEYSVALMEELGLEGKVMVVSSEFHLYRAGRIFERFDMEVCTLPAPTPNIGLVPLNSYVREYCSIVVMGLKDMMGIDE